ncbi:MAG: hypothetical protein ACE5KT_11290 [Methanosarcinales archaeon]|nr:hypothetical protein [Methanosarcinales archaeon]
MLREDIIRNIGRDDVIKMHEDAHEKVRGIAEEAVKCIKEKKVKTKFALGWGIQQLEDPWNSVLVRALYDEMYDMLDLNGKKELAFLARAYG